jgi:endonuclease/exonuclease/phosphatase family metal-dependent hydrolase
MNRWGVITVACLILVSQALVAAEPFKVLTYNIRYLNNNDGQDIWEHRKETVVKTILNGDLVGLQEVVAEQYEYVLANTSGFNWYGIGRTDGLSGGEMTPVGWRTERFIAVEQGSFWLSEHPWQIGKAGWDAALPRIASWVRLIDKQSGDAQNPQSVLLINVHLDHRGQVARKRSAAQLRDWIAQHRGNSEVVLIGDFNAKLGSDPLDQLLEASTADTPVLQDSRKLSTQPDPGPDSTWNSFKQIETGNRIDHVLIQSGRLRVEAFETLDPRTPAGRFASDHLPLVATLNFLQPEK